MLAYGVELPVPGRASSLTKINFTMRNGFFFALCGVLLAGCGSGASDRAGLTVIDGQAEVGAKASDLFAEVRIAPLQTTEQSLVGVCVVKAERIGDRFFFVNKMFGGNNLLSFDTTGRFIRAIDRRGHGPQEYTYLGDFITAPDSNALILTTEKGKYLVVDTADNYLATIRQEPPYYYDRQFLRTNDSTCIVFHNGDFPQGSDLLEVDARTFAIRRSVQARNIMDVEGSRPLSLWEGRVLYCGQSDTIYDATDIQNRRPLYLLDFGEAHRAVFDKQHEALAKGDREQMLELVLDPAFCLFYRMFENSRWIVISATRHPEQRPGAPRSIPFFVLYDKESGRSYRSEHISWDALNIGPLENIEIVGCDAEGTLYALWYGTLSEKQKRAVEAAADDRLSPELKVKLLARGEEDNPVLFMLR